MCNSKLFDKQPENSIAIQVPDGYLVAEPSGCLGEYPGIRVGFWTEDGFLADIAVVESKDARDATGEPSDKYEVHLWDFGEERCHDLTDLEFTSGDVTRHVSRLEALATEYGTAHWQARSSRGNGRRRRAGRGSRLQRQTKNASWQSSESS